MIKLDYSQFQNMKKIGKPLAIRIEEQHNESPSSSSQRQSFMNSLRPITLPDEDDDSRIKIQHHDIPNNVVEFEQFLVQDDKDIASTSNRQTFARPSHDLSINNYQQTKTLAKSRREFSIQIPDTKGNRQKGPSNMNNSEMQDFQQPPAPSNKKSIRAKNFVFPCPVEQKLRSQIVKIDNKNEIQELLKSFDKQRQQFYRQKSKFQKQLLVKQGQIEMLQKMLTGRIGQGQQWSLHHSTHQQIQSLIIDKDIQINQLLQKIAELSRQLSLRGEELRQSKMGLSRLQNVNESLLHQIYLLQKKQANIKTTQQFYELKRKPITPTGRGRDYDDKKQDFRYPGFDNLQKRLDNLKQNRMQYEDRGKIKSQMSFTQTTKFQPTNYEIRGFVDYNRRNRY